MEFQWYFKKNLGSKQSSENSHKRSWPTDQAQLWGMWDHGQLLQLFLGQDRRRKHLSNLRNHGVQDELWHSVVPANNRKKWLLQLWCRRNRKDSRKSDMWWMGGLHPFRGRRIPLCVFFSTNQASCRNWKYDNISCGLWFSYFPHLFKEKTAPQSNRERNHTYGRTKETNLKVTWTNQQIHEGP